MSIKHAILGYLSWKPFTGYELKKRFADSLSFHWSGNSNQVYGSLVALHEAGLVDVEIQPQEKRPARKVYAITGAGRAELRAWLLSEPELPETRDFFALRLAWAEELGARELGFAIDAYARLLEAQALMSRERLRRGEAESPSRSPREAYLWRRIEERRVRAWDDELAWLRSLSEGLADFPEAAR